MSVEFMDGFDWCGAAADLTDKWCVTNSGTGLSIIEGRDEVGSAVRFASAQLTTKLCRGLGKQGIDNRGIEYVFGFNMRVSSLPASDSYFLGLARLNNFDEGNLALSSTGTLKWQRDGTDIAETTGVLTEDAWHHVEVRVEIEDGGGSGITLEIAIDGSLEDFSGTNRTVSTDPVDSFRLGPSVAVGTFDIDDFYLINPNDSIAPTARIGISTITMLIPDGDGAATAWSFSGGASRWESVDEAVGSSHDGDTSYVHSQTAGQQNLFTFTDSGATAPDGVALNVTCKKNSGGGAGCFPVKRTGSTTVVGTNLLASPASSYANAQEVFDTDGEDNAWTIANVNASEFGVEMES